MLFFNRASLLLIALPVLAHSCRSSQEQAQINEATEASTSEAPALAANDVSILFPLSPTGTPHKIVPLLKTTDRGAKGELLPQFVIDAMGNSQVHGFITSGRIGKYAPVAMRIDHCAPLPSASRCLRQLRLVWQLDKSDAAIHTVYNLTTPEFTTLVHGIAHLKAASHMSYDDRSLDVHPVMAKEGATGPFTSGLINLIKTYAGADNLAFVAFFTAENTSIQVFGPWNFAALTIQNGTAQTALLAHHTPSPLSVRGFSVTFLKGSSLHDRLDSVQMPDLRPGQEQVSADSSRGPQDQTLANADDDTLHKAYDFLLSVEHPFKASVPTHVCSDCHIASAQRALIEEAHPDWQQDSNDNRFEASASTHQLPFFSGSLHNFGYFNDSISISQRTVNETKVVLDWVNANVLSR